MKCRNIVGAAGLTIVCFATGGEAQMLSDEPVIRPNVFAPAVNRADLKAEVPAPIRLKGSNEAKPLPSVRTHSMQFVILSAGVYGASFADMHETLKQRKYPWWYEADPLARPLVKLPAPAYYASGFALATGLNWVSWKMAHSRRWHRLSAIPQLLAISGNTYGFTTNRFN